MQNQNEKSSTARIFSIIVLIGIVPAWFFYIGIKFTQTLVSSGDRTQATLEYLNK